MWNHRIILVIFGILAASEALAETQEPTDEIQAASETQEVKKNNDGVQVKEKGKEGGDTYNFYFQKAPGPNKVQQGGGSQTVEQQPAQEEAASNPPAPYVNKKRSVDLFGGLYFIPGRSAAGITLGGEFVPQKTIGARLDLFSASSNRDNNSSFSAYGTEDKITRNDIYGGGAALTYGVLQNNKVRISPMVGFLFLTDKDTTTTSTFSAFGSKDSNNSNSHFHVTPYAGLSAVVYLSDEIGANIALAMPGIAKYTNTSINFVFSI